MCHERIIITLEDVATLDHPSNMVDRLLSRGPVVLRFLALSECVSVVLRKKGENTTSNRFSIFANSFSRSRLEAAYKYTLGDKLTTKAEMH
jgi:hypothetical protein